MPTDKSVIDFLLMPVLCTFFGMLVFFLGQNKVANGGKAPWKWAGVAILMIGVYTAWGDFSQLLGLGDKVLAGMFQSQYAGRKFMLAINASFLIPVLSAIACVIVHMVGNKRAQAE